MTIIGPKKMKLFQYVLKYFNWKGSHMLFPYQDDDGKYYLARIDASDVLKIIKWKNKRMMSNENTD